MHEPTVEPPSNARVPLQDAISKVLGVLSAQQLAVIATSGSPNPARCYPEVQDSIPESALVAFTQQNDLRLFFQTGRHTRKAANLANNPYISFVINHTVGDTPYPNITLQYQGKARQLTSTAELEVCKQHFVAKNSPTTEKYFNDPSTIFFEVLPIWIGCTDYSGKPPQVFEIDFTNGRPVAAPGQEK